MKIKNQNLFFVNNNSVDVEIDLQTGLYVLIGENGVGKSSFLNFLKTSGRHFFNGDSVAFMDQFPIVALNEIRLKDVIEFLDKGVKNFSKTKALELIEKYEIEYLMDRSINHYSGGENQIFKFILLLSQDSSMYFLDEPLQYLDKMRLFKLKEDINIISQTKCVVVVEHRDELLADLNPMVLNMKKTDKGILISGS